MKKITTIAVAAFSFLVATNAMAADRVFNAEQEARIKIILQDTLKEKPEMIIDALKAYQDQKIAEENKGRGKAIVEIKQKLLSDKNIAVAGSKNPDVRILEFFDYNCGYCRHMTPAMQSVLKNDAKVQWVFVDFPILGEASLFAAQFAQAVNRQAPEKFYDFHTAVMNSKSSINEDVLVTTAKTLGLNIEKIRKDMKSDDIKKHIENNITYAAQLKIQGTPALIIGDDFLPGAADEAGLKDAIKKARNGGK